MNMGRNFLKSLAVFCILGIIFLGSLPMPYFTSDVRFEIVGLAKSEKMSQPIANWTFMVYMSADCNLEGAGVEDINEMEVVGSTPQVNVVVQCDRIDGEDTSNGDWKDCKRFYITKDSDETTISSKVVEEMGEVNMGDPETLVNFTYWVHDTYPAQHYALILWNHGGAFWGVCWDDTNNDYLNMANLSYALAKTKEYYGKKLDIVAFDACLMGELEVLYQIKNYCDYAVGSEPTEPGDGWPYELILPSLVHNPSMSPTDLCKEIVNDYVTSYTDGKDNPSDTVSVTMGAFDMAKFEDVWFAMNVLSIHLANNARKYNELLRYVRSRTTGFDPGHVAFLDITQYPMYDVGDFIDQLLSPLPGPGTLSQYILDANLRNAAKSVLDSVKKCVFSFAAGARYPNAYGMTIYFPCGNNSLNDQSPRTEYDPRYNLIEFAKDCYWDEFLDCYSKIKNANNLPPAVKINSPIRDEIVKVDIKDKKVEILGSATDDGGVSAVYVKIDDADWLTAEGTANWVYKWKNPKPGLHIIYAKANDGSQDSPVQTAEFFIKITGSETNLIFGMQPVVIAGVAICAGVAVGIVSFWQKPRLGQMLKKLKERFTH